MKFAKTVDLVVTVVLILLVLFCVYLTVSCFVSCEEVERETNSIVEGVSSVDGSGPADGYIVLGGISLAGFGLLAEAAMYMLAFFFGTVGFFGAIFCLVFICNARKYKKTGNPNYIYSNIMVKLTAGIILFILMLSAVCDAEAPTVLFIILTLIQFVLVVLLWISRNIVNKIRHAYFENIRRNQNYFQPNNMQYANNNPYVNNPYANNQYMNSQNMSNTYTNIQ